MLFKVQYIITRLFSKKNLLARGIEPKTYVLNHNISAVRPYFIESVTAETDSQS